MTKVISSSARHAILVIAPAWIGDMIMAQSLFKLLKSVYPRVAIDVLAPSWTLSLVERMPEVRHGIILPFKHGQFRLISRYLFAKKLRKYAYDHAIVLPASFKSALVAYWAKIPLRTGWLGEWRIGILNDVRRLRKQQFPLMVQQFIALGQAAQAPSIKNLAPYYPALSVDKSKQKMLQQCLQLNTSQPILALCPGAEYGPAKRWPIEYFAQVAKKLLSQGWQIWIFGSKKESALAQNLMHATSHQCINLTGKTSLVEVIDLMSLVQAVICNDSGLMHMAAALGKPLLALYGSSTPDFTPPLTEKVKTIYLRLECSPCFERRCPLNHFNCMQKITPKIVLSLLLSLCSIPDKDAFEAQSSLVGNT